MVKEDLNDETWTFHRKRRPRWSTFLWATAYIFVKNLVEDIPPCMLLSLRFSLAAIILAVILFPKLKKINKKLLIAGISMGTALFFEFFSLQLDYSTQPRRSHPSSLRLTSLFFRLRTSS
ncbi:MAG: EamA family transporter [Eubacterium sp.]